MIKYAASLLAFELAASLSMPAYADFKMQAILTGEKDCSHLSSNELPTKLRKNARDIGQQFDKRIVYELFVSPNGAVKYRIIFPNQDITEEFQKEEMLRVNKEFQEKICPPGMQM